MSTENNQSKPKTLFSGVQPSGSMTLGNYLGALRNFKLLEDEYNCLFSIVDLHAITVRQDPSQLRKRCKELLGIFLSIGLNPERSLIYFQSHVPQHCELSWILNCDTYMGELSRMTQYKDKSAKNESNINAGLFTYPALMAADILLYQTDIVPVGDDQRQHLEISRDIAIRFNNIYGDVFTIPEGFTPKAGARIMSLQEPNRKMSKSDPEDTYVAMLDDPDIIRKKLRRAVTDSDNSVRYDPKEKPGVSNLMDILSAITGQSTAEIESIYGSRGYGTFKDAVADAGIEELRPFQERYAKISTDKAYLNTVMSQSSERASRLAQRTLDKVHRKVGMAPRKF